MNNSNKTPFRINKYKGWCRVCSRPVEAKAGSLVGKWEDGKHRVLHNHCVPSEEWIAAADAAWAYENDPQR